MPLVPFLPAFQTLSLALLESKKGSKHAFLLPQGQQKLCFPFGIPVVRRILLPLLLVLYATTVLLSEAKHQSA